MALSDNSFIIEGNQAKLFINLDLYSLSAIKKTAYKFASQCSVFLQDKHEQELCVLLTFTEPTVSEKIQEVIAGFSEELMDQDLREIIAKESEAVRNLILAQAFSKTSLIT